MNRGFLLVSIFPTLIPLLSLFCRFVCITSPNPTDSFLSQPSFTIFAPTINLWHSYSLSFLVSLSNVSFSDSNSLSTYFSTQSTSFPFFFLSTAFNIIHSCCFVFIIAISMHKGYFLMFCSFLSSMLWVFSLYDLLAAIIYQRNPDIVLDCRKLMINWYYINRCEEFVSLNEIDAHLLWITVATRTLKFVIAWSHISSGILRISWRMFAIRDSIVCGLLL
jgi:hypothetical protein